MNFSIRGTQKVTPIVPRRNPAFAPDCGQPDKDSEARDEALSREERRRADEWRAKRGRLLLVYFSGGPWHCQAREFYENEMNDRYTMIETLPSEPSDLTFKGKPISWDRYKQVLYRLHRHKSNSGQTFYEYVLEK